MNYRATLPRMLDQTGRVPAVSGLYAKLTRGQPMVMVPQLRFVQGRDDDGLHGGRHPRQVAIAIAESLRAHDVKPEGARSQLIVDGAQGRIASGDLLTIGPSRVKLRVSFTCEPCAHGARMADTPIRQFRQIERHLGIVLRGGTVTEEETVTIQPGVFEPVPHDFPGRVRWALDRIPPGRAVTSLNFLTSIGAGRAYLRVLPRWLRAAHEEGRPAHRVLTAHLTDPSWAPGALARLADEGCPLPPQPYSLVDALWFSQ